MSEIGLLLHSVCLLSTAGNEEHMIDDFAGAYDELDVSLRFVAPNRATPQVETLVAVDAQPKDVRVVSDAAVGIEINQVPNGPPPLLPQNRYRGAGMGKVVVSLRVKSDAEYSWIMEHTAGKNVCTVPVLFNLGRIP